MTHKLKPILKRKVSILLKKTQYKEEYNNNTAKVNG